MNTSQYDFLEAVIQQLLGFTANAFQLAGTERPSGVGNNTITAEVGTPLLNFKKGSGSGRHFIKGNILKFPCLHYVIDLVNNTILFHGLLNVINNVGTVTGAQNNTHPLNSLYLIRSRLRITACNSNDSLWIETLYPTNKLTGFLVPKAGNRAGINNIHISCICTRNNIVAGLLKKSFHRFRFKLVYLTAQRYKRHCRH